MPPFEHIFKLQMAFIIMKSPLLDRQKVLLCLIDILKQKNVANKFMIVKTLFLLKQEERIDNEMKFYNFFPYQYGPFSNSIYYDLNKLEDQGLLVLEGNDLHSTKIGQELAGAVDVSVKQKIQRVIKRFGSEERIRRYVYKNYPSYTVKSRIGGARQTNKEPAAFSIGYESRDIDSFLNTMVENSIDTLVDIRWNPFSMNFSFTGKKLNEHLYRVGIGYLHIPALGIEGSQRKNLVTPADYRTLFTIYKKRINESNTKELEEIKSLALAKRIALLCFEKDQANCHRGVISEHLASQKIPVTHL